MLDAAPALHCPNLRFRLPGEWPLLLAWLRRQRVERVELQHYLNHAGGMETLGERLGVPMDLYVHDNIFFCPRLTLVGPHRPLLRRAGGHRRVRRLRGGARQRGPRVTAGRHPARPVARPVRHRRPDRGAVPGHRPAGAPLHPRRCRPSRPGRTIGRCRRAPHPRKDVLRVAVLGAINQDKGLEVLRDCALAATARALPIEFVLIGFSVDDAVLMDAGVFVTGKFARERSGVVIETRTPQPRLSSVRVAGNLVLCIDGYVGGRVGCVEFRSRCSGGTDTCGRARPGAPARRATRNDPCGPGRDATWLNQ